VLEAHQTVTARVASRDRAVSAQTRRVYRGEARAARLRRRINHEAAPDAPVGGDDRVERKCPRPRARLQSAAVPAPEAVLDRGGKAVRIPRPEHTDRLPDFRADRVQEGAVFHVHHQPPRPARPAEYSPADTAAA